MTLIILWGANASNAVKKRLAKFVIDRQKVKVMDGYSLAERWVASLFVLEKHFC